MLKLTGKNESYLISRNIYFRMISLPILHSDFFHIVVKYICLKIRNFQFGLSMIQIHMFYLSYQIILKYHVCSQPES